ncbi:DUF6522 family protein [Anderseniella sp. Alg231-50]|uniref:DUF6522 family protein n=1 Tax=Anderseniella sp. Alg231-50 TaxID=1922226 RepID=UPI000D5562FF
MDKSGSRKINHHLVEFDDDGPVVNAVLVGDLLNIPADQVPHHIRQGSITTLCEAGIDEHDGEFRLSFFHGNRRAQIEVNSKGLLSNRTVIDFGDKPLPASLRGVQVTQAPKKES